MGHATRRKAYEHDTSDMLESMDSATVAVVGVLRQIHSDAIIYFAHSCGDMNESFETLLSSEMVLNALKLYQERSDGNSLTILSRSGSSTHRDLLKRARLAKRAGIAMRAVNYRTINESTAARHMFACVSGVTDEGKSVCWHAPVDHCYGYHALANERSDRARTACLILAKSGVKNTREN